MIPTGALLARLSRLLDEATIPYMLTGSLAGSVYGFLRSTWDIDIVINANQEQIRTLKTLAPEKDYYFDLDEAIAAWKRRDMFNVIDNRTGWKIDFIFLKPTPFIIAARNLAAAP